ncbi:unnamed protein product [Blepharisma stoltei]|uniref:LNR domain-containing protein n=1 Tax=Blepharisma stoltei TaxID=1481888 RepID=A0AAU9J7M6_9CILI|nr:unnamed protein product [Blepharisma stoltei]
MKSNGTCDEICNTPECDYDGGDCGNCASGCWESMLGDGHCDAPCNVSSCSYDNYDCGCANGCTKESYGQCKDACMTAYCKYDTINENSKCQDQNLSLFSLHYTLINKNITLNASVQNCTSITNCTSSEALDTENCYDTCNSQNCIYSWNQCSANTCADSNCLSCYSKAVGSCFKCKSNMNQFYGYCLSYCPAGYESIQLFESYKICSIIPDRSTKKNPAIYYVTSVLNNVTNGGNGTYSNPFTTLSIALASIYTKYSIIYLLDDGQHYLYCIGAVNPLLTLLPDSCNPLIRNFNLTELLIAPYSNSSIVLKTKPGFKILTFTVTNTTTLTLKNISFSGKEILSTCPPDNQYCTYCANITLGTDGNYYSDQGTKVTTFLTSATCATFHTKNLFYLYLGAQLYLENVNISNWRMEFNSIISSFGGNVTLNKVNFDNIRCMYGSSNSYQKKYSVIYFQDCGDPNYNCGSFSYTSGVITRINNGYEYGYATFSAFFTADRIRKASFKNLNFTNNIAYFLSTSKDSYSNAYNSNPLIKLTIFRILEVSNCIFLNNAANSSLIYLYPRYLSYRSDVNSFKELIDLLPYHVWIHDSIFESNYADYGMIVASYQNQLQRILLENITMTNNGVTSGPLISFSNTKYSSDYLADTIFSITSSDGNLVNALFKKREFILRDSVFKNNYIGGNGIYDISQLFNVNIHNLTIESNGSRDLQNINTVLWSKYVADDSVYMNKLVSTPNNIDCLALSSATSCYNYKISDSSFNENFCNNSSPSINFIQTQNTTVTNCSFEGNIGSSLMGICIQSTGSNKMKIKSSTFTYNINNNTEGVGVMSFNGSLQNVTIDDTLMSDNYAIHGTGVYFQGLSLVLSDMIFDSNIACSGLGAVYFSPYTGANTYFLKVYNSTFKKNKSLDAKGGAIYLNSLLQTQVLFNLTIKNSSFISNSAQSGSALYIENSVSLTKDSVIDSCKFSQNNAEVKGTIGNFFESGILTISHSSFISNYAGLGSALFFSPGLETSASESKMMIVSSNFTNNSGKYVICTDDMAIYSYIETVGCLFEDNEGPVLYLIHDHWKDTKSTISRSFNSSEHSGGALHLTSNSTASCESTFFFNNTSSNFAGAIRAEGRSSFYCSSCIFSKNTAQYGGVLYFDQESFFNVDKSSFSENCCSEKGSAIYVVGSSQSSSLSNSKLFKNHAAAEGLIALLTSKIDIDDSEFFDNTADGITPGIYSTLSKVNVTNCKFSDQTGNYGSFVYLASDSEIRIESSSFMNGISLVSGGSISSLSSSINVIDSVFQNSTSASGNAIMGFSTVLSVSGSKFLDSYSSGDGAVIDIYDSKIFIEKSYFENFSYTAIGGIKIKSVGITGSSFINGKGKTGGALSFTATESINIASCTFSNNTAVLGGALYFIYSSDSVNKQTYSISSTEFSNNTSSCGGAIYVDNVNIDINSCKFTENSVYSASQSTGLHTSGIGGALNLACSSSGSCNFNIGSNIFSENKAVYDGGAVCWRDKMPVLDSNTFSNNEAAYGGDIASYPVNIITLNPNTIEGLKGLASGQLTTTPLILALVDHLNQVVITDNYSQAELISRSKDVTLSGNIKVTAVNGVFNFSSFLISAEPGSNVSIKVHTDGVDSSKSVKANDGLTYNSSLLVSVSLRECALGEATIGINCVVCPEGYYSLKPKSNQCLNCPDSAICYGNYTIVPKKGYWRCGMLSDKFWSCSNSDACIGSDPYKISYTGECATGYTGNLCQNCEKGYSKQAKDHCIKCDGATLSILKTVGIMLAFVMLCCIFIRTTKKSAYKPKSMASVHFKIFINYVQLIALTTTFNLSWPNYVKQLFAVQNNASFVSDQVFSFDCLLYSTYDLKGDNEVYYQKLFIMAVIPFGIPIIAGCVWISISLLKRSFNLFKDNMATTSIISIFLMHPSLLKAYFSSFDCKELDYGKYWLADDLDLRCWNSQHIFYVTAVSVPAILLWGIGVPTLCLFLLWKNKKILTNINVRIKYGFLFNGYKTRSYYWEFVIIYRKILIICCSVFLGTISVNIQALTALFVLLACLYMQLKIRPYNGDILNKLEAISITVSAITIYCGMYYLTGTLDYFTELLFFILIVSANVYFVGYWILKAGHAWIHLIIEKIPILKKKFHKSTYDIIHDSALRESYKSGGFDIPDSPNRSVLNSKNTNFQALNIMDLFLGSLKKHNDLNGGGGANIHSSNSERNNQNDEKSNGNQVIHLTEQLQSKNSSDFAAFIKSS